MTSPAVFVLSLALVYHTFGVALEQTADHNENIRIDTMEPIHALVKETVNNVNLNTKTRTNVNNHRIDNIDNFKLKSRSHRSREKNVDNIRMFDEIYTESEDVLERNLNIHRDNATNKSSKNSFLMNFLPRKRVKREDDEQDPRCEHFTFDPVKKFISHPHGESNKNNYYYSNMNCVTTISGPEGTVVRLTFVDMFHIEYHPECSYDYLEIRDGKKGYSELLNKVCGEAFPRQITTTGPNVWLKFYSDDTIEYEGFKINFEFIQTSTSFSIPESCYQTIEAKNGFIDSAKIDPDCLSKSEQQSLDVLWTIIVPENHKIYLNFTQYTLAKPNECEENLVQVFGYILEYDASLALYCGSVANPVTSKGIDTKDNTDDKGNIMYVRLYASKTGKGSVVNATFTAFRSLDPNRDEKCDETEFNCEDNTCIDIGLECDSVAHCRLKTDEDADHCFKPTDTMLNQTHIKVILIIFCLILSGMSFVFFFKCIRKLYQDHKIIKGFDVSGAAGSATSTPLRNKMQASVLAFAASACWSPLATSFSRYGLQDACLLLQQAEAAPSAPPGLQKHSRGVTAKYRVVSELEHIRQSTEDRLDTLVSDRLTLDAKRLQRDSEPRASLERDNQTNEMFKQQRKFSQQKIRPTSIDSDFIQETRLDLDDEPWRREVEDVPVEPEDIRIERNGRPRRSDLSRKEESIRSKKESEEKKQIRDVSVGAPDTKESGCQTRESLFQTDPAVSSDGSGTTNSRGFSTFGYSGATIVRPSPPQTSQITIELLRQATEQEKPQKKFPDRRPMSTETTRSAPDVIIVSKPIR